MNGAGWARAFRNLIVRQPWAVAASLVGVHLIVSILAFDPVPHSGGDNTAYLSLARSLLDHGAYLELWDPARPPHTQYPPGFPVILAAAWTLGIRSWAALKLMMVGFSGVAVGVSYLWMRERTTAAVAAALGLLLAVAPGLAGENQWVLSDIPFWAATMGALLALERGRDRWGIGLAFAALALRTAGLPLLVAIIGWKALRRRWKPAAITLGLLVVIGVLWSLRSAAAEGGYVSQFWMANPYDPEAGRVGLVGLLGRLVENADRYTFTIAMRTLAGGVGIVGAVTGAGLVAAAVVGLVRQLLPGAELRGEEKENAGAAAGSDGTGGTGLIGRIGVVELFAVLYVGMLLLWPAQWASDRFLIPFLPVLMVYAARGLEVVPAGRSRRAVQVGSALVVLGLAVSPLIGLWTFAAGCRDAVRQDGPFACIPPEEQAFIELAEWTRGKLPDDAVVISRKPRIWYWYAGYPGEVYPFSRDRSRVLDLAAGLGARYVVLDELGGSAPTYLVPAVAQYRRWYCAGERVERGTKAATLMGVLPTRWDPEVLGISGEPDAEPLRVPRCPAAFTPGRP